MPKSFHGSHFISLENVSKSFPEGRTIRAILNEANADFEVGEFVAILGKSGSGKSTLLNLISGIDIPDSGRITVDNIEVTALREPQVTLFRRDTIGFIFQFFNLIPTLTVLENVSLPSEIVGNSRAEALLRSRQMMHEVGLQDRERAYPDMLSGGEQQRVAIARALVHNPRLVLADEPTGNLDSDTGKHILKLLDKLTRKAGKNLIMVTHSMDAASRADRVLYLHGGHLTSHATKV